jgi:hypothetical protein
MTPVMDRCACPAAYPIAECVTCTPTPDEGLHPDHRQPIPPPAPRAPADDPHGLAQPNTTCVLVIATAACLILDAVVVVGVVKVIEWLLGLLG